MLDDGELAVERRGDGSGWTRGLVVETVAAGERTETLASPPTSTQLAFRSRTGTNVSLCRIAGTIREPTELRKRGGWGRLVREGAGWCGDLLHDRERTGVLMSDSLETSWAFQAELDTDPERRREKGGEEGHKNTPLRFALHERLNFFLLVRDVLQQRFVLVLHQYVLALQTQRGLHCIACMVVMVVIKIGKHILQSK